jgi:serine/threonine-protein kinase HipA
MNDRLDVWLDGQSAPLGHLTGDGSFKISFAYEAGYLKRPDASPLSIRLPVRAEAYSNNEARAFFDNLLPEGEPRTSIAIQNGIDAGDVFGLLKLLGADAPGAVSVLPEGSPPAKSPGNLSLDYTSIADDDLLSLVTEASEGRPPGRQVRFSLAGVQAKIAVAMSDDGGFLRPTGSAPTTHILKIERNRASDRNIVANEFACLEIFRRLGLRTAKAQRRLIGNVPCLLIDRYDRVRRTDGLVRRLHQEDAAQVLGIDRHLKYEQDAEKLSLSGGFSALFGPFASACRPAVDARDSLFQAAFLNWILGNSDGHLKNFSLLYGSTSTEQSGRYGSTAAQLAPFYDVVCVAAYPDFSHDLAMRIGPDASWNSVCLESWQSLAKLAFGSRSKTSISRALDRMRATASKVLPEMDGLIAEGLVTRAEAKPVRDVIGSRLRHLNDTMKWSIEAKTDEAVFKGGGWLMS